MQVEYTISPPGISIAAALQMISYCLSAHTSTWAGLHSFMASGFFLNMPSPEQGASTSIAWKNAGKCSASLPLSSFVTTAFLTPILSMLEDRILHLALFISLDTRSPSCPRYEASCVDFPPGAAHKSSTLMPGFGASRLAADMALGS